MWWGLKKMFGNILRGGLAEYFIFTEITRVQIPLNFVTWILFFFTTNKQGLVSKTLFRKTFSIKILHYKFLETVGNNKVF